MLEEPAATSPVAPVASDAVGAGKAPCRGNAPSSPRHHPTPLPHPQNGSAGSPPWLQGPPKATRATRPPPLHPSPAHSPPSPTHLVHKRRLHVAGPRGFQVDIAVAQASAVVELGLQHRIHKVGLHLGVLSRGIRRRACSPAGSHRLPRRRQGRKLLHNAQLGALLQHHQHPRRRHWDAWQHGSGGGCLFDPGPRSTRHSVTGRRGAAPRSARRTNTSSSPPPPPNANHNPKPSPNPSKKWPDSGTAARKPSDSWRRPRHVPPCSGSPMPGAARWTTCTGPRSRAPGGNLITSVSVQVAALSAANAEPRAACCVPRLKSSASSGASRAAPTYTPAGGGP